MGKKPKKPRPPPRDTKCDAHIGVDYSGKTPRVLSCGMPATVTLPPGTAGLPWETWVCGSCAKDLREKYIAPAPRAET